MYLQAYNRKNLPASKNQVAYIKKLVDLKKYYEKIDYDILTSYQAGVLINKLKKNKSKLKGV